MTLNIPPNGTYGKKVNLMIKFFMKKTNLFFFRLMGKWIKVAGRPVLLLITVGSKTGKVRQTPLGWFPETDKSWIIVASNNGSINHPSWFLNLAKNPNNVLIKQAGRRIKVVPEILEDKERETAWSRVIEDSPQYSKYQKFTDRIIPVILLKSKE